MGALNMKAIVLRLLLFSNFANAAPTVMQLIDGTDLELVSIGGAGLKMYNFGRVAARRVQC